MPVDEVRRQTQKLHEADDDAANWLNNVAMTAFAK